MCVKCTHKKNIRINIMTDSDDIKSIKTLSSKRGIEPGTFEYREQFIRSLMKGTSVEPLIDCNDNNDDSSYDSNDTRYVLGKKPIEFDDMVHGEMGCKLRYVKSGTTGHTLHAYSGNRQNPDYEFAVKVVAYPRKSKYGSIYNVKRPENAEIKMLKVLSKFVLQKKTPHIVLPICTFNTGIDHFVNEDAKNRIISNKPQGQHKKHDPRKKYMEFIKKYEKGKRDEKGNLHGKSNTVFHDTVSVLISEWANKGDLLGWFRNYYRDMKPIHWKVIFFQVLSVLAVIQNEYPAFRHNDLKINNILLQRIDITKKTLTYGVCKKKYVVANIGYYIKIWDFDFACIPGVVDNDKIITDWTKAINVTPHKNQYYDMHFFFNTMIRESMFPEFMDDPCIPKEAKEFLERVVPKEYQSGTFTSDRGRFLMQDEYTTPRVMLENDPYFAEFRTKPKYKKKKRKTDKKIKELNAFIMRGDAGGDDPFDRPDTKSKSKSKSKDKSTNKSKKEAKTKSKNKNTKKNNSKSTKLKKSTKNKKSTKPKKSRK